MQKIEDREEAARRQKESNRAAVKKYQSKWKRINCRMTEDLYKQILDRTDSVNAFIIAACEEKLRNEEK